MSKPITESPAQQLAEKIVTTLDDNEPRNNPFRHSDRIRSVPLKPEQREVALRIIISIIEAEYANANVEAAADEKLDKEIRRFQDGVRDKLISLGVPDSHIDGAGCDSGDPLDFTLAEVTQGVGYFIDRMDELEAAAEARGIERAVKAICANCIKHRPLQQVDKHWFHLVPTKAGTHFEECAGSVARALQPDPSYSVRLVKAERERVKLIITGFFHQNSWELGIDQLVDAIDNPVTGESAIEDK